MRRPVSKVSRRSLLLAAAGGVIAAPMAIKSSRAASNTVTITGWGGNYQEIFVRDAFNPFTEETGIKVNVVQSPDLARVKVQILTGNVEWDVFDGADIMIASGSKSGFWEKLDGSVFKLDDMRIPPTSDSVPTYLFAAGLAWDPAKFGDGKHPQTFAEFFDIAKFPGRRSLMNRAFMTLEVALLADGVAPKDVYPLDLDRAFKALDRIKPSIATWASTNTQTIALVQTGEVDFTFTPAASRVKSTTEDGGGRPLAFSFEQNLYGSGALAVLKGTPNKENAIKLLTYIMRPEVQARLSESLGLLPVSKSAATMLTDAARRWLPNWNNPKSLFVDPGYWADHLEPVTARFKEWVLS
ncbi:ABC transporter substrate-binding protein [Bradyrhizobium sp. NAS96.2]|uniref:ABC transporter substrate-binding protein n=1 Tax=Bradyrhizobium sp. NAS96.2 TaxID=1680160 RepID=UPI00093ACC7D|nr:ABC transporter substrate-binding protein [Bradyrhizobium sp. NAS96.2]OKO68023.1 hypothetical protein AC628_37180 [Bradyrhizobium sp. NAS96.2]